MFTSTDIRQKGVTDFLTAYQQNCALNGSIPIKPILNGIGGTALFIDISKVKFLLTKKSENRSRKFRFEQQIGHHSYSRSVKLKT